MGCVIFILPLSGGFVAAFIFGIIHGFNNKLVSSKRILDFLKISSIAALITLGFLILLSFGCGKNSLPGYLIAPSMIFLTIFVALYLGIFFKKLFKK